MSVIYVLLTISIVVAVIFFIAFIVSVKSGQYDDSYTPAIRMLFEDELVKPSFPLGMKKGITDKKTEKEKIQPNKEI